MVKFCLRNRYGADYAIYECMCNDCNWMGELRALDSDSWDHYRYCPQCGSDDIDEFDDGKYRKYIIMPTEWGVHGNDVDTGYEKPPEYDESEGVDNEV